MIKQLQKKFVLSAMLAISVLLVVVLGGINIFNMISSNRQTNKLLFTLSEKENSPIALILPEVRNKLDFFTIVVTQDDTLGAIYFVARTDDKGNVWSVDTSHISSISPLEAKEYAESIENKGNKGTVGRFKYQAMPSIAGGGETIIFLDVTKQIHNVWQVFLLSIGVGVLCWLIMLFFIILLSKKAIKPIATNIEKQKQFVTDAGHEIKTPLAIIMANTDAMELHYGENKYSKNIRTQIFRLSDLTQDLLALAKMEENVTNKTKELISLTEIIEDELSQFSENFAKKEVDLKKNLSPELNIYGSKEQIQRLVSILLDNAAKYVTVNGTVEVSITRVNKYAVLEMSNTADNLGQLQLDKIFDRFYRGDDARTQKSGGYGIGLSAAKAIVEAQKGTITAHTVDNKKIIFTIKLSME